MTTNQIQIIPAPAELLAYTHASLDHSTAQSLADEITHLKESGYTVLNASASRSTVPACYRSAYKMSAPHWYFDGCDIIAVNAKLENRTRGASISEVFEIAGQVIPEGFRCFKRLEDSIIIRRK